MVNVWRINGYDKKDPDKSTKGFECACPEHDCAKALERFARKHPDVVVTEVTFRGEYEEL